MSSSSDRPTFVAAGDLQVVSVPERQLKSLPPRPPASSSSTAIVDSAGSGSGDFHQYRQMRRKEQDRLARMDADHQKRKEITEFIQRREERLKAAEERTAKKRLKRQKKKHKKQGKKCKLNAGGEEHQKEQSSDEDGDSENDETEI
ncbi:PRKR-interacting protein 1 [Abeliophyllum distichum]|uniref:PRKR-interacting protein 1 n=1 Tax=Abeliophyllum distichum TaxID=126358 RepID=A0ABD1P8T7_9LAMI